MKKPIATYEKKYPENKQKSIYYGNCETGNTPSDPGFPAPSCCIGNQGGQPGSSW